MNNTPMPILNSSVGPNLKSRKRSQTKVSSEVIDRSLFSLHKYIESSHDEPGICAIGQYDTYYDNGNTSDKESALYTAFWSNEDKVSVLITTSNDELEAEIDRFNSINKHLKPIKIEHSTCGLDFVRDKTTLKITYSR